MLELSPKRNFDSHPARSGVERRQNRNLLIALALLMIALAAVLFTDRQFWLGADHSKIASDIAESAAAAQTGVQAATKPAKVATPGMKKQPASSQVSKSASTTPAETTPVVTGNRVTLPPLDVEVVAGNNHRRVRPGVNATKVEITGSATGEEPLSPASLRQPEGFSATYPLLAQHMNVQGSVVLQAVIGADGVVQTLRVLRGPAILTSAAEQAVRQWKFKPIIENGQAVESKATITVNFTIKVGEDGPNTSVAQSRVDSISVTR
jgi:TonB family protein